MTSSNNKTRYNADFYLQQADGSKRSALVLLNELFRLYKPSSVLDIGCGAGSWLSAAEELGASKLFGYEGSWVKKDMLLSKNIDLTTVDLSQHFVSSHRVDLALSLEVAEHLPSNISPCLVSALCKSSDVVLFGAGIPYQWGTNHINLEWQSYWANLFKHHGFVAYDIIRTATWKNGAVEWWYRQNALLYVKAGSASINPDLLAGWECRIYDVVLPEYYDFNMRMFLNPTFKRCFGGFRRYFNNLWKCKQ